jgi:hypothetical protein
LLQGNARMKTIAKIIESYGGLDRLRKIEEES